MFFQCLMVFSCPCLLLHLSLYPKLRSSSWLDQIYIFFPWINNCINLSSTLFFPGFLVGHFLWTSGYIYVTVFIMEWLLLHGMLWILLIILEHIMMVFLLWWTLVLLMICSNCCCCWSKSKSFLVKIFFLIFRVFFSQMFTYKYF